MERFAMNSMTLSTLAKNALIGTTILGIVSLCLSLLLRRYSAATRHYYWLMIIACLLLLPALSAISPKYRVEVPRQVMAVESNLDGGKDSQLQTFPIVEQSPQIAHSPSSPPLDPVIQNPTRPQASASHSSHPTFNVRQALLITWGIGTAFITLWIAAGWLRIKQLISHSTLITEGRLVAQCATISQQLQVKRPFKIRISERTLMPMVAGTKNATLILPAGFEDWDSSKQIAVLAHEIGHIQRYDCSTQLLGQLLCAVYWFHPISWIINRKLQAEAEAACDDLAIRSGAGPSQYAEHLLTIARSLKGLRILSGTTAQMAKYSKLENRLRRILNRRMNRNQLTRMSALICTTATVTAALLFSTIRITASNPQTSEPDTAVEKKEPKQKATTKLPRKETRITLSVDELNKLTRLATIQTALETQQTGQEHETKISESTRAFDLNGNPTVFLPITEARQNRQSSEKSEESEIRETRTVPLEFAGRLESAMTVTIRSQLDGPATVLWRAADGDRVERGALILEFESDELVNEFEAKKIELAQDEGKINAAKSLLEDLQKNKALEIETGELNLRLTELKQQKGQADFKLRLKKAESDLSIAIKRLEEAESTFQVTQAQHKAGVAGADKVRAASIATDEAKYKIELASDTRENLLTHDRAYEDVEQKLSIQQAKSALQNSLTQSNNKIAAAEEALSSLLAIHSIKESRVNRIERQLNNSKIFAPFSGVITRIQTPEPSNRFILDSPPIIKPGSVLRKRQPIMSMQDSKNLVLRFAVPNKLAPRISLGQEAKFIVDAAPELKVSGQVAKISDPVLYYGANDSARHIRWVTVDPNSPAPEFLHVGLAYKVGLEE